MNDTSIWRVFLQVYLPYHPVLSTKMNCAIVEALWPSSQKLMVRHSGISHSSKMTTLLKYFPAKRSMPGN